MHHVDFTNLCDAETLPSDAGQPQTQPQTQTQTPVKTEKTETRAAEIH